MFITFEGTEGSGKSTVIALVKKQLEEQGYKVFVTREPGGTPIGEQIRTVILNCKNTKMDPLTEALLFAGARRQHIQETVLPMLKEDYIVICDRFTDSTLAYQGYAGGISLDTLTNINNIATGGLKIDLTIYLDIDPQVGLERIAADEHRECNRLDQKALDYYQMVRKGFLNIVRSNSRCALINAAQPLDIVVSQVMETMEEGLKNIERKEVPNK